jgi:hypothetical protein
MKIDSGFKRKKEKDSNKKKEIKTMNQVSNMIKAMQNNQMVIWTLK